MTNAQKLKQQALLKLKKQLTNKKYVPPQLYGYIIPYGRRFPCGEKWVCVCNHDSISACFDHKFSGIWGAKNCTVLPKSKIEERYVLRIT